MLFLFSFVDLPSNGINGKEFTCSEFSEESFCAQVRKNLRGFAVNFSNLIEPFLLFEKNGCSTTKVIYFCCVKELQFCVEKRDTKPCTSAKYFVE
jgi:hypothetical protein